MSLTSFSSLSLTVQALALGLAAIALYFIATTVNARIADSKKLPLPSGPKGLPFIGNLPDLLKCVPHGTQHLLFERWARQYGDLYRVKLGFFTQYMVNSDRAVKAIFESKNAFVSANRPRWIMSNEHICNGWNVLLINADTGRWKQQRKVIAQNVGSVPKADAGVPVLEYESLKFLLEVSEGGAKLQQSSHKLWESVMRYTYSAFTTQMFGLEIPDAGNQANHYIHETGTAQIVGTLPGTYIVDILPLLERLPFALKPWARDGQKRYQRDVAWSAEKMRRLETMSEAQKSEVVKESLMNKILLDEKTHLGFSSNEEGAYFCLMLTIGAADTSQISTWEFLKAMMTYPDIQRKAQQLLDKAVDNRVPVWEDYANNTVPYVRCLVKETWRWRPPVGLGHPHVTTDEIVYEGQRIPKGSRIHLNGWAIQHDPNRHQDPDEFIPERYEDDETTSMQSLNSSDVSKRDHFAFGAGRRVCPGYNVAERSLALAIMRILWAFEVKVKEGAKLPLNNLEWRGTFPGLPGPDMPVVMIPRSEERVRVIREEMRKANEGREHMQSM